MDFSIGRQKHFQKGAKYSEFFPSRTGRNLTRQIPCTFFSSTTFPTVDSSAKTLAAACILLTCLLHRHLDGSSAMKV